MNPVFDVFPGAKSYLACVGLIGLSIYNLSQNDITSAIQNFLAALAVLGVRNAIARQ